MTIEKMLAGQRSTRNQLIMEILRDYGYVDSKGMGVRIKVGPLMKNKIMPTLNLSLLMITSKQFFPLRGEKKTYQNSSPGRQTSALC